MRSRIELYSYALVGEDRLLTNSIAPHITVLLHPPIFTALALCRGFFTTTCYPSQQSLATSASDAICDGICDGIYSDIAAYSVVSLPGRSAAASMRNLKNDPTSPDIDPPLSKASTPSNVQDAKAKTETQPRTHLGISPLLLSSYLHL
jgi:hypothetical protein